MGKGLTRRDVLKAAAGLTGTLPWLGVLDPLGLRAQARAAGGGPQKLLIVYTPIGTSLPHFRPRLEGSNEFVAQRSGARSLESALGRLNFNFDKSLLKGFSPWFDRTLILDGIDFPDVKGSDVLGHKSSPFLLTGDTQNRTSLDVRVAQIRNQKLYVKSGRNWSSTREIRPLLLGHAEDSGGEDNHISWLQNGPLTPLSSPKDAFRAVYGPNLPGGSTPAPSPASSSPADKVDTKWIESEFERMSSQLASDERKTLRDHREMFRALCEDGGGGPVPVSCGSLPNVPETSRGLNYAEPLSSRLIEGHTQALVHLMACDAISVGVLKLGSTSMGNPLPEVPGWPSRGFHEMSHQLGSGADGERLVDGYLWWSRQVQGVIKALSAVQRGEGTLLDDTLVIWCTELQDPNRHNNVDMPVVLFGGQKGTGWKMGRWLPLADALSAGGRDSKPRLGEVIYPSLLNSVLQAYGADTPISPRWAMGDSILKLI